MATESSGPVGTDRGALARIRGRLEGPNTIGNSRGFWLGFAVAVLALAAFPVVGSGESFSLFLVLALLGLSLSLVWGYSGVLSFGQVVFFGVGGYTFGVVSINFPDPTGITAAAVAGVVGGGVTAALLGYFMFYGGVRDVYVTIITLVTTMAMHTFMAQTAGSAWTIGEAPLGGFNGMPGIPLLELGITGVGSFQFVYNEMSFLGLFAFDPFYYLALALLLATYLGLRVLVNSDFGRVMVAVREDQDRTQMFGYDVKRIKLLTFTLGGALAALSGVLYAARNVYISPPVFALWFATLPVIWVSVGGRKSLLGAVIATIAIEYFRLSVQGEMALVVLGAMLLVFILALPGGIVPWVAGKLSESAVPVSELDDADAPGEVSES
ncbi:ABC transporter permease subunit [Halosimplex pelagicum]|uniref:Urea ABC transporter permease n=1 Tax=Halosimplex pelagicum TaxID=869886 RepID=A0A7D5TRB0_9EURY|nr:urea ABC transporter permease [Halosimplex pelagicum]QLH81152.1 urea ABC transporter permease [Halosimplex pelagicum]